MAISSGSSPSVAIIAITATKTAGRPLKYLRQAGFSGRIYPINPGRETVLGERAWPSLAALPEAPEHAYIVAGTEAAVQGRSPTAAGAGMPMTTALADGFNWEVGHGGASRAGARLRGICAEDRHAHRRPVELGRESYLPAPGDSDRQRRRSTSRTCRSGRHVFVASPSGGMIGTFVSRAARRAASHCRGIRRGRQRGRSLNRRDLRGDPRRPRHRRLRAVHRNDAAGAQALSRLRARRCRRGKPVIAYKLGRSAAARELAISHTGALAGEDDVAEAFLAACGIARVDTLDGLIEGFPLWRVCRRARGAGPPAVAVVTTTAGGATMVVDPLATRGHHGRAADAADAGAQLRRDRRRRHAGAADRPHHRRCAIQCHEGARSMLTNAPEFDLVLAVVGSSARFNPELAVRPIIDSAARQTDRGFPGARGARRAGAAAPRRACRTSTRPRPAPTRSPPRCNGTRRDRSKSVRKPSGQGQMLDELEAYAVLDRLGVPRAPSIALDANIKQAPTLPFPYPVAVKVLSGKDRAQVRRRVASCSTSTTTRR